MTQKKKTLVLALVGLNVLLLGLLVHQAIPQAQAQSFRTTDYVVMTGSMGTNFEVLFIVDLSSKKMIALKFDKTSKKMALMKNYERDLLKDFKVQR